MIIRTDDLGERIRRKENFGTVIAIGDFDGVHKGHRALLKELDHLRQEVSGLFPKEPLPERWVLTFTPHPRQVLSGQDFRQIYTQKQKETLIEEMGSVDAMIMMRFTPLLQHMNPEDFFQKILIERYHAKGITVGDNFRFGDKGAGDAELLQKLCRSSGVLCHIVDRVTMDGEPVSSTRIRTLLVDGRVKEAAELLGYPYFVEGIISPGKHMGRRIAAPTINMLMDENGLEPKKGVYASRTLVNGKWYDSISNVGNNPTFGGESLRTETYLFGFDEDVYGKNAKVVLLKFMRPEQKFENAEALSKQLSADIAATKAYLKQNGGHYEEVWG